MIIDDEEGVIEVDTEEEIGKLGKEEIGTTEEEIGIIVEEIVVVISWTAIEGLIIDDEEGVIEVDTEEEIGIIVEEIVVVLDAIIEETTKSLYILSLLKEPLYILISS